VSGAALSAADFEAFFAAVYPKQRDDEMQKTPFPWQQRLAAQVCETGEWPGALDLPTGTGKTSVLDIAVFAMAVDAARDPPQRKAPRRAILVVDRRTVVDQAYARASALARLLAGARPGTILGRVAEALHGLRGEVSSRRPGARPLEVAYLRGAIPRDDGWARDPSQPLLGVSTVDQVGSRLLFRGYGVSPGMRSVHAGLLGNDIVYFLDEVQLSQPFAETLDQVRRWRDQARRTLPVSLRVVMMSATHRSAGARRPFGLDDTDRQDPRLRLRLDAPKPVTLELVKVSGDEDHRRSMFAQRLADLALSSAGDRRRRRVAVVVNRVDTALAVHDAVHERIAAKAYEPASTMLVTGRMRPLDRRDRERQLRSVAAGIPRGHGDPRQIVIATQCIEAGADLDFDVLITECASLDALIQRFGRLDRLGEHRDARGVVAIRSDQVVKLDDPIYGGALAATWQWLGQQPTLDFGSQGQDRSGAPAAVWPPERHAPTLLPAYLDLWSQTSPAPRPDPDVALWLHGEQRGSPEVNIVWRADLTAGGEPFEPLDGDMLEDLFETSPPLRQEAMAVPLWAAAAWLRDRGGAGVSDVEGAGSGDDDDDDDERDGGTTPPRWAIRWWGDRRIEILRGSRKLEAGDTIIVPTVYGGIRAGTWAADSKAPVVDRGDEAQLRQRGRLVVRIDAVTAPPPEGADPDDIAWRDQLRRLADQRVAVSGDNADDAPEQIAVIDAAIRSALNSAHGSLPWLKTIGGVPEHATISLIEAASSETVKPRACVVVAAAVASSSDDRDASLADEAMPEIASDDQRASRTGVEVALGEHLKHVEDQAKAFADVLGLPGDVATSLVRAAAWHDAGKADPRFQLWLAEGDEVALAEQRAPLAKSASQRNDRRWQRKVRERAGYPHGARHELASVALLESAPSVLANTDRDLVLHLIASHHGWCRPYAPVEAPGPSVEIAWRHRGVHLVANSDHGQAHAGAGVVDRFWAMTYKYGWWGLAWLETLIRLADHRASEAEQAQPGRKR